MHDIVTTVSAFESLLTFTLFSGTTHSCVRKLIWATGIRKEETSMDLMASIKRLNHPVFHGNSWQLDKLKILNRSNPVVEEMYKKLTNKGKLNLEPLCLMLIIDNESISSIEKASFLSCQNLITKKLDYQNGN